MVVKVMRLFSTELKGFDISDARVALWCKVLEGIDLEAVYGAAMRIVCSPSPFAPSIGQLRDMALRIEAGLADEYLAVDAWANVVKKMGTPDYDLPAREKKALKKMGGIFSLKNSANPSIDRAFFMKCFESVIQREISDRNMPPSVREYIDSKAPRLPAKVVAEGQAVENEMDGMTPEERMEFITSQCDKVKLVDI